MTQHWPLPIAAGLIAAAAALGLWQRERAADAARPRSPQSAAATPAPAAEATPASDAVAPATKTATAVTPLPPEQHAQFWNELKTALQTKTSIPPSDKGNGALNFSMDGTAIDLQAPPNWRITVYNVNPKQPDQDSPNFSKCVGIIEEALGVDQSKKPASQGGQTLMRTQTKLGLADIARNPTGANTWTVVPSAPSVKKTVESSAQPTPQSQPQAQPAPKPEAKPAAPAPPAAPTPPQKKPDGETF